MVLQEQDHNPGANEAQHRDRGAQRRRGGPLPAAVQARDGAPAAGEDEPRRGAAPDTCRHQRSESLARLSIRPVTCTAE